MAVKLTDGKPAVTGVEVVARRGEMCLVRAIPETGRMHQIRVHLAYLGLPILGDPLYALPEPDHNAIIQRQALHATSLTVIHPRTLEPLTVKAELPPDFKRAIRIVGLDERGGWF
eukprot:TRINITY_DN39176_c0_g1_i1.p2 TRINITY_DN39176_c0_g1~~TRINITY_DN39176_c0_g1_i1.p2  ORF type:complete len:115 (+),score=21.50 TRINITY_DN39176_c0_g1_i1:222-566(+)